MLHEAAIQMPLKVSFRKVPSRFSFSILENKKEERKRPGKSQR